MKDYLRVKPKRYDTRLFCNLAYTHRSTDNSPDAALYFHLIMPTGKKGEKFPLLVYIGGGSWRTSKPERHLPELNFFAQKGFAVASIQYRTTESSSFPAQIEDVRTSIRYFRSHAEDYNIDPEHIFVMGASAGAYLAAMATILANKPTFRGDSYPEVSDRIDGAICLYGIFDFSMYMKSIEGDWDKALPIRLFIPQYTPDALHRADAETYITGKTAPFLLLHGTADMIIPYQQSSHFHDLLEKAGSDVSLYLLNYAKHASEEFSQPEVQKIELSFMEQILRIHHIPLPSVGGIGVAGEQG